MIRSTGLEGTPEEPGGREPSPPDPVLAAASADVPGLPRWVWIAIFFGALLVRGAALVDLSVHDPWFSSPVVDERTNVEDARRVVREGIRIEKPYWKPPLYPHLIAVGIALGIGSEQSDPGPEPGLAWTVKILQALLDSWTAVLVAAIALRLAARRTAAIWAGGIHALGFLPVFYVAQFLDTTVYTFLVVASVRLTLGALGDRNATAWLSAGVVAGLAAITRATMLVTLPVLALAPWTAAGVTRSRARDGALILLGAGAMILPVTLMNARFGGDRVLISSNGGINFYIGNRVGDDVGSDGLTSVHAGPRWSALLEEALEIEKPSDRSAHYYQLARREIAESPRQFLGRIATKIHALLHSFDVPNNKNFAEDRGRSVVLRVLPARSGVVVPLALAGLIFSGVLLRRRALLLGVLASQALIPVAFFVAARYRVPLIALGAVPAGALIAEVLERSAPARRRRLLAATSVILFGLLAWDPHGWRDRFSDYVIDPVGLGFALDQAGDAEGARLWYERALEVDPGYPEAELNLGHLELAAGNLVLAEMRFGNSVASDPDFAIGWNALGTLQLGTERPGEAVQSFERAIAADPHYAPARAMYGQMLESASRIAEARNEFEAARRSDPTKPLYWLLEARSLWRMHRPSATRTLLTQLATAETRPFDAREEKLRREILEDLEIWPDGPPLPIPEAPGPDEVPPGDD